MHFNYKTKDLIMSTFIKIGKLNAKIKKFHK